MARAAFEIDNQVKIRKPKMYAVILHNDDYTTMEFVVEVLVRVFHKTNKDAAGIMMSVHENGQGVAGVYTYDIAMTKKLHTETFANEKGYPLKVTLDETIE